MNTTAELLREASRECLPGGIVKTSPYVATQPFLAAPFSGTGLGRLRRLIKSGRYGRVFKWIAERVHPRDSLVFLEVLFGGKPGFAAADILSGLAEYAAKSPQDPWLALFASYVLMKMERIDQAWALSRPPQGFTRRFGWMRIVRGRISLIHQADYRQADREFRAVLESCPGMWRADCFRAEVHACTGKGGEAMRIMDGVVSTLPGRDRLEAVIWRGQLRGWLGDFGGAIADLDHAISNGGWMACCWKGAAKAGQRRWREAVKALDLGLRMIPVDREALTLRGEAKRRLGDARGAKRDLDAAISISETGESPFWALANRALLRAASGDLKGMLGDVSRIPSEVKERFHALTRIPISDRPSSVARLLRASLEVRPDMRRTNKYLYPIWDGSAAAQIGWTPYRPSPASTARVGRRRSSGISSRVFMG